MTSTEHLQILENLRIDPADGMRQVESLLHGVAQGEVEDSEGFIRNVLAKGVVSLLKRKDLDYVSTEVMSFLRSVLSFLIARVPSDRPEVAELLARLFSGKQAFFAGTDYNSDMIYEGDFDDDEDMADNIVNDDEDPQSAHLPPAAQVRAVEDLTEDQDEPPPLVLKLLQFFAKRRGLDAMLDRLNDTQRRIPASVLRWYITFFSRTQMGYTTDVEARVVKTVRERARALYLSLPDDELKNEDKGFLTQAFRQLSDLGDEGAQAEDQQAMEVFVLEFALKCFNSPFLEKRLAGLTDFKEIVASVRQTESLARSKQKKVQEVAADSTTLPFSIQLLSSRDLSEWFQRNKIVERLVGEGMHIELIRRSGDLLRFFVVQGTFREREIELIWNSLAGKHESIWTATLQMLAEVAKDFDYPLCDAVYRRIASLSPARYDLPLMGLLLRLCESAICSWRPDEPAVPPPTAAVELMWACLRDDSLCSDAVCEALYRHLYAAFTWDADPRFDTSGIVRERVCGLALDAIKQNHSVPQALRVFQTAIQTYPTKRGKRAGPATSTADLTQQQVLDKLVQEYRLFDLLLVDAAVYKQRATARAAQLLAAQYAPLRPASASSLLSQPSAPGSVSSAGLPPLVLPATPAPGPPTGSPASASATPPTTPAGAVRPPLLLEQERLAGRLPHNMNTFFRLCFLETCMRNSGLTVGSQHIDALWDAYVLQAITIEERDAFLSMLTRLAGQNEPLLEDLGNHIFEKACSLVPEQLTPIAYEFFEQYLLSIGELAGVLRRAPPPLAGPLPAPPPGLGAAPEGPLVTGSAVPGDGALWAIALDAPDRSVGLRAIALLRALYSNVAADQPELLASKRAAFVHCCMQQLSLAAGALERGVGGGEAEALGRVHQRIDRCLALLKACLDDYEAKVAARGLAGAGPRPHGAARGAPVTVCVSIVGNNAQKIQFQATSGSTVGQVRARISRETGIPVGLIRLISTGKELKEDARTLSAALGACGERVTLHVARRPAPEGAAAAAAPPEPEARPAEAAEAGPGALLSSQEHFDTLFDMLRLDQRVAQKVWDLLMLLPTNERMLSEIRALETAEHGALDWDALLDDRSTFRLYYSLQIVEMLGSGEPAAPGAEPWAARFQRLGGADRLFRVLYLVDFSDPARGPKRKPCLALLLRLLASFYLSEPPAGGAQGEEGGPWPALSAAPLPAAFHPDPFVRAILQVLSSASAEPLRPPAPPPAPRPRSGSASSPPASPCDSAPPLPGAPWAESEKEEAEVVRHALRLLVALAAGRPGVLSQALACPAFRPWLRAALLEAPDARTRAESARALARLAAGVTPEVQASLAEPPLASLMPLLLGMLREAAEGRPRSCEAYFGLLARLVAQACAEPCGALQPAVDILAVEMAERLRAHPVRESRACPEEEDRVLVGYLQVLLALARQRPGFKEAAGPAAGGFLLDELFHRCLFDGPTPASRGPTSPPRCKSRPARLAAFELLAELAKGDVANFEYLTSLVLRQQAGGDRRPLWHYAPAANDKGAGCAGYTGLRNLGATCYMNSLMQQFFMIPRFRRALLAVPSEDEADKQASLLWQLQSLFAGLQESVRKYVDTQRFCGAYRDIDGQPMNTAQQMDVDEFFNMLFDRLEAALKPKPQGNILQLFFGGTVVNQIICRDCPHRSERDEPFYVLALDVKNKRSVTEALELYIQGEMLEGDNAYQCAACAQKRDALKRCCLSSLPNCLVLHLKRFEWDLDTMKKFKLNDHVEFPPLLDMEPYTREGLARREAAAAAADGRDVAMSDAEGRPERGPGYYRYQLEGILVHTGTAESGHYYSYIQEREAAVAGEPRRWLHFNDTQVETFDEADIGRCCFGGAESVVQWDATQGRQVARWVPKPHSAYMLFYERVEPEPVAIPALPEAVLAPPAPGEAPVVPPAIYSEVWEENGRFLADKNVFDVDYFDFCWKLVNMYGPAQSPLMQIADEPPPVAEERAAFRTAQLAVHFFVETLAHAKEKAAMGAWVDHIRGLLAAVPEAARWLLDTMADLQANCWLRQLLLACTVPDVRTAAAGIILQAVAVLRPLEAGRYLECEEGAAAEEEDVGSPPERDQSSGSSSGSAGSVGGKQKAPQWAPAADGDGDDESLDGAEASSSAAPAGRSPLAPRLAGRPVTTVARFCDAVFALIREAAAHWRHFAQFFGLLRDLASLGPEERALMLRRNVAGRLVDFYLADDSPHAPSGGRHRQKKTKMGDKFGQPSLAGMAATLSLLARSCTPASLAAALAPGAGPAPPAGPARPAPPQEASSSSPLAVEGEPHLIGALDRELLFHERFLFKVLKEQVSGEAMGEIFAHATYRRPDAAEALLGSLRRMVESLAQGPAVEAAAGEPFFEAMAHVVALCDDPPPPQPQPPAQPRPHRAGLAAFHLFSLALLPVVTRHPRLAAAAVTHCARLAVSQPPAREVVRNFFPRWCPELLVFHPYEGVREAAALLLRALWPDAFPHFLLPPPAPSLPALGAAPPPPYSHVPPPAAVAAASVSGVAEAAAVLLPADAMTSAPGIDQALNTVSGYLLAYLGKIQPQTLAALASPGLVTPPPILDPALHQAYTVAAERLDQEARGTRAFRLVPLLRTARLFIRSEETRAGRARDAWAPLWAAFLAVDERQDNADENKLELLRLMYALYVEDPTCPFLATPAAALYAAGGGRAPPPEPRLRPETAVALHTNAERLFRSYVHVSGAEGQRAYNAAALPTFYRLARLLAAPATDRFDAVRDFLYPPASQERWGSKPHHNLDWAITALGMQWAGEVAPDALSELFAIARITAARAGPAFRHYLAVWAVPPALRVQAGATAALVQALRYLELGLEGTADERLAFYLAAAPPDEQRRSCPAFTALARAASLAHAEAVRGGPCGPLLAEALALAFALVGRVHADVAAAAAALAAAGPAGCRQREAGAAQQAATPERERERAGLTRAALDVALAPTVRAPAAGRLAALRSARAAVPWCRTSALVALEQLHGHFLDALAPPAPTLAAPPHAAARPASPPPSSGPGSPLGSPTTPRGWGRPAGGYGYGYGSAEDAALYGSLLGSPAGTLSGSEAASPARGAGPASPYAAAAAHGLYLSAPGTPAAAAFSPRFSPGGGGAGGEAPLAGLETELYEAFTDCCCAVLEVAPRLLQPAAAPTAAALAGLTLLELLAPATAALVPWDAAGRPAPAPVPVLALERAATAAAALPAAAEDPMVARAAVAVLERRLPLLSLPATGRLVAAALAAGRAREAAPQLAAGLAERLAALLRSLAALAALLREAPAGAAPDPTAADARRCAAEAAQVARALAAALAAPEARAGGRALLEPLGPLAGAAAGPPLAEPLAGSDLPPALAALFALASPAPDGPAPAP